MEFSVDDYHAPQWSALPAYPFYFEIIREGNLLGKIQVKHKQFNLIGRLEDLCDIYIDNPLVSRKHAVLQAKENDSSLYLMDLGSQHGTFVNKVRLPMRTYKKLQPFDSIKFGVSSRVYILRCPTFQDMKENEENQKDNQFVKLLEQKNRKVSKEELKAKYLDMLQNDPYYAANQAPRKLQGRQQQIEEDQYEGIDWGMTDQREIYSYKNDNEVPIEPDLLRRMNLDSTQLTKLGQYEDLMRKYQEIESELNEITSKEKRQFGLDQKLQGKKEKFEKKFVESLQALEKAQEWLRTNLFGEVSDRNKKNPVVRQKQNDTFGDDVFLDRTLQKKQEQILKKDQIPDSESYWMLQAKLKEQSNELKNLQNRMIELQASTQNKEPQNMRHQGQQEDELQMYMKQNEIDADNSDFEVLTRQIAQRQSTIESIKNKLRNIIPEEQINKIVTTLVVDQKKTLHEEYLQKSMQDKAEKKEKKLREQKDLQQILNRIQNNQKDQEQVDQQDIQIFKYYKKVAQDNDEDIELDEEKLLSKLRYQRENSGQSATFVKPIFKARQGVDNRMIKIEPKKQVQNYEEEQVVDLTKQFQ